MKHIFLFFLMLLSYTKSIGQDPISSYGAYGPWSSQLSLVKNNIPQKSIASKDNAKLNAKWNSRSSGFNVYAVGESVDISIKTHGEWDRLNDGRNIWRYKVASPTAKGFQFVFDEFYLPEGVVLFFYDKTGIHQYGPYTRADNREDRKFSPGLFTGKEITIELNLMSNVAKSEVNLHLSEIAYAFKNPSRVNDVVKSGSLPSDFPDPRDSYQESENCIIDAQCTPYKEDWCDEIRSVVLLSIRKASFERESVWGAGTATLITTATLQDPLNPSSVEYRYRPYFLTARHVVGNSYNGFELLQPRDPDLWVVHYNFQSPTCDRTVGNDLMRSCGLDVVDLYGPEPSPTDQWNDPCPDIALVQLINPIPFQYNLFFAGWDATKGANELEEEAVTTFHHPLGDIKKVTEGIVRDGTEGCVRIDNMYGFMQPGSSGAPWFFNPSHQLIAVHNGIDRSDEEEASFQGCDYSSNTYFYVGGILKTAYDSGLDSYLQPFSALGGVDPFRDCVSGVQHMELNGDMYPGHDWQTKNNILVQANSTITSPSIPLETAWVRESPSYMSTTNQADYTFRAGDRITLKPGFKAVRENRFKAEIGSCNTWADGCGTNYKSGTTVLTKDPEEKQLVADQLRLQPNPTSGQVQIMLPASGGLLRLYDATGRLLKSSSEPANLRIEWNLEQLQAGMYLVQWQKGDEVQTQKLIIQ